jgi:DNA-binding transcriptional LysR family regulator
MFTKLFMESGLSLDRLRALVEVGAAGSIVKAAQGEPVRQSQYSRQIKELEAFFRVELAERHGQGVRLTPNGRELARISRFFLLGLSNFQRGCLAEGQTFRLGASATFLQKFAVPALAQPRDATGSRYSLETIADAEIERRLHELTLDFGVVTTPALSRPLQTKPLWRWKLQLWVPQGLRRDPKQARRDFQARRLPVALARRETSLTNQSALAEMEPHLDCNDFLEAHAALAQGKLAALLPDFFPPPAGEETYLRLSVPAISSVFSYHLAWNPRLLRLNPHAVRRQKMLLERFASSNSRPPSDSS